MWTFSRRISVLFFLIGVFLVTPDARGEDDFEFFFASFKEKRDAIASLQARFEQQTVLPEEIITTEGRLAYSRPRCILFESQEPQRAILVEGRRGYEYDAEIRQVTRFDLEDNPRANIFFLGFDDDTEMLRKAYDVSLMITDDARGRQGLKIRPREETDEAAYFIEVNLFLRDEDFLPYRIHIVNDAESQVFIDVLDMETSTQTAPETTRIHVPMGVKIIENDRVVATVDEEEFYIPDASHAVILDEQELPAPVDMPRIEESVIVPDPASSQTDKNPIDK